MQYSPSFTASRLKEKSTKLSSHYLILGSRLHWRTGNLKNRPTQCFKQKWRIYNKSPRVKEIHGTLPLICVNSHKTFELYKPLLFRGLSGKMKTKHDRNSVLRLEPGPLGLGEEPTSKCNCTVVASWSKLASCGSEMYKNAKLANLLFFNVKYAKFWCSCRGCQSSWLTTSQIWIFNEKNNDFSTGLHVRFSFLAGMQTRPAEAEFVESVIGWAKMVRRPKKPFEKDHPNFLSARLRALDSHETFD